MKADERLAEIRKRTEPDGQPWYHYSAMEDIKYLLIRIDQLERLVPDYALLDRVYEELKRSGATRLALRFGTLAHYIRKFREQPGQ